MYVMTLYSCALLFLRFRIHVNQRGPELFPQKKRGPELFPYIEMIVQRLEDIQIIGEVLMNYWDKKSRICKKHNKYSFRS